MVVWALRVVTFIINSLLLTGFALIYMWLQNTQFRSESQRKLRTIYQIALTIGFLVLFHVASILTIIQDRYSTGYGWNYLNFQIGVLLFALLFSKSNWLYLSLSALMLLWYWWLPGVKWCALFLVATLILMWVAERYSRRIISRQMQYYAFALLFGAPTTWASYISLGGINVGWVWQIATGLIVAGLVWFIDHQLTKRDIREAILLHEARTDTLTQLNNFRVFNEDLEQAFKKFKADGTEYLLYTFDIDHFKQVNDQFGHLEGNAVLREVADTLRRIVRGISEQARAYRIGGEEFCFIVFDSSSQTDSSKVIANRVRHALSNLVFSTRHDEKFQITISLGQDQVSAEDQNYMEVYKRADQKLYQSKQNGRNTVTVTEH